MYSVVLTFAYHNGICMVQAQIAVATDGRALPGGNKWCFVLLSDHLHT